MSARPGLGAIVEPGGTRFRVWAPLARAIALHLERPERTVPLEPAGGGVHQAFVPAVGAGTRYRLSIDGAGPFPDPASRFQPEGVHGPSEVVDPGTYRWRDPGWGGVPLGRLVLYELHVGTFTAEGTFAAAARRLPELRDLGVNAVELMPVAAFPGRRNWGYDGAALFAPARAYGAPDDLRRLVDEAHALGLAVHLDVVYNHLGPDGAYAAAFSPHFFTERHRSPWGSGINLDDRGSAGARAFFVDNACAWVREYHLDGLRLDATHALVDESPRHFLAQLGAAVRAAAAPRPVLVIAEDARNLACIVRPEADGGWGMDAVWSDDFHHLVRRRLAGDRDGYFRDYSGSTADLATALRQGWLYAGQRSEYWGRPRGTPPVGVRPEQCVIFVQNHDQVGNRALGERLHHQVGLDAWRAASALLLVAPETPLLFMGQEWAASTPFRFFTDHSAELGALVTAGRREEFRRFEAFARDSDRARIPDPQAEGTFRASVLAWDERGREPHASTLRFTRALLALRRDEPALAAPAPGSFEARSPDPDTVVLRREAPGASSVLAVVRLGGPGEVAVPGDAAPLPDGAAGWEVALTSEDPGFAPDPSPARVLAGDGAPRVRFARAGAVVLRSR